MRERRLFHSLAGLLFGIRYRSRQPWTLLLVGTLGSVLLGCSSTGPDEAAPGSSPERATPEIEFSEQLIMDQYAYPFGIGAGDLDRDGDLDLTSADALPHNNLYWFENDGGGNFTRHFIQKNDPERLERHMIGDVNSDLLPDVVIVKNLHGDLLWFENLGNPADDLWPRHVITKGKLPGAYDVALSDLDADGDLDVAASSWRLGNHFAWFENPGKLCHGDGRATRRCYEDGHPEWKKYLIEAELEETRTIRAADFDGDGDADLLGTAVGAGLVAWYENSGKPASEAWRRHDIDRYPHPIHGEPTDLDGDGDMDVVMAFGMRNPEGQEVENQIVWYENNGDPREVPWTKYIIADQFQNAFEVVAGDLDRDGHMEVVATGWGEPGQVAWFRHGGDPRGGWSQHTLKDNWRRANQVLVADLDGDRDLDVAAIAERGTLEFRWWRNDSSGGSPE